MKKLFIYTRPQGYIEFSLPSQSTKRVRIYAGDSRLLDIQPVDQKMFRSYMKMGLVIKDYLEEPTASPLSEPPLMTMKAPIDDPVTTPEPEPEVPEAPAPEPEAPVSVPDEPVSEPEETEESLMKLTRAQLVALANERGIEVPSKASKMQIAKLLLGNDE